MTFSLRQLILGSPLPSEAAKHERLSNPKALAVFSSDALSSVAYATEEILLVLMIAGTQALRISDWISLSIVGLLAIVASSYFQTIHAYPKGGGTYIVTKENLGPKYGQIAAAALLVDYVLTVAVSASAGSFAVVSAFPEVRDSQVAIGLAFILLITWGNLRGVKESGAIFAAPTYLFIALVALLIVTGFVRLWTGSLVPQPAVIAGTLEPLGIFLVLRAFSSGCTALTGVEAISDGVPAFRAPESKNAAFTLLAMVGILAFLFVGITLLADNLHIIPNHTESVLSQIGRIVFGESVFYYSLQVFTALILFLAANTAFADFPRLASFLAKDGYLPRQLANIGDRLVFSNGILLLTILAALLLIKFHGDTHSLIPLYALGVFVSFTLSQTGMVARWIKVRGRGWKLKAAINAFGAITTCIVLGIIFVTKFFHGAWIVVILLMLMVALFNTVRNHYRSMGDQVAVSRLDLSAIVNEHPEHRPYYKVIVPLARLNRSSLAAIQFARSISPDVTAVIIDLDSDQTGPMLEEWNSSKIDVAIKVLPSPYRSVVEPLLEYLEEVDARDSERGRAVVVLPELIPARWWHHLLHNQIGLLIKTALIYSSKTKGIDRVIINIPYHLRR
jgi:amino acid transporter